jgi:hypothetical protein
LEGYFTTIKRLNAHNFVQIPFILTRTCNTNLLVLADCVSVAYANLHKDFVKGKVVMMGCPKFDDAQSYIDKFTEIFKTAGINSITTVYMEVPCCSGLPMIINKGLEASGQTVPMTDIVISTRGKVLEQN